MSVFARCADADIVDLVASYPFAWIVPHADPAAATPMPVLLETDAGGAPVRLLGHLPRRAPVTDAIRADATATFLFTGPHRYIEPIWLERRNWAPTWNFAVVRITGLVQLDKKITRHAIERLVAHLEGAEGWQTEALGDRYETLLSRIVGFTANRLTIIPRMKLGQDERADDRLSIIEGLGVDPIVSWMERFE